MSDISKTQIKKKFSVRAHVPSNDVSGEEYKPVYEDTKNRMDNMFGKRSTRNWPLTPQTCSKCYSVAPSAEEVQ